VAATLLSSTIIFYDVGCNSQSLNFFWVQTDILYSKHNLARLNQTSVFVS